MESNTRCLLKESSNSRWKTISVNFWENQIQYLLKEQWEHVENQMHCFNLGGLFRGPFWGGGTGKITPPPPPTHTHTHTPCLNPFRIMLETWKLVRKYIHMCGFRKYGFSHQGTLDFATTAFPCRKNGNNTTFTQNNIVRAVLEIFRPVFRFCKVKCYC